jgi:hypothetical protein
VGLVVPQVEQEALLRLRQMSDRRVALEKLHLVEHLAQALHARIGDEAGDLTFGHWGLMFASWMTFDHFT